MKIGVTFPQTEIGDDPGALKAYAQAAESLGYDHILAYDHVVGANPELGSLPGIVEPGIIANRPATLRPAPLRLMPSIRLGPVPPISRTVVVPAFANIP